ncbi:MAG: ribonuclease P protein component, partial [Mycoplasmataceae bacterium]|nr:ribonuclease P protein component [Mycoplasmataceae bacterium]
MKNNFIESIKDKKSINNILISKNTIWTKKFKFIYEKNNLEKIRFIIFVPKKLFKLAVKRNKIKRQIRDILLTFKKIKSFDVGILILKNYKPDDFLETKNKLHEILNNLR